MDVSWLSGSTAKCECSTEKKSCCVLGGGVSWAGGREKGPRVVGKRGSESLC